jgi:hypothetical protein
VCPFSADYGGCAYRRESGFETLRVATLGGLARAAGNPRHRRRGTMAVSFSASDYELAGIILPHRGTMPGLPHRPAIFGQTAAAAGGGGGGGRPGASLRHRKAVQRRPDRARVSRASEDDTRSSRQSASGQDYVDRSLTKYIQVELLGGMLKSGTFRGLVLAVITMNSVLVGLQTDVDIERGHAALFFVLDFIFLTFFTVEIVLKWLADFSGFWRVGWNVFDFLIVSISLAGKGLSFMSSGRVLRTLRVLRAFRTIKSIRMVRGLQMIVSTVFRSLPDMGNIFMLLGIVMFIFAVAGVNIFGHDLPARFGSLHQAMYTLFIALTQDGWAQVFNELTEVGLHVVGSIYFFFFIMIGAFVFMNIISGVIVTNFQRAHEEFNRARQLKFRILNGKDADEEKKEKEEAEVELHTRLPTADELAREATRRRHSSDTQSQYAAVHSAHSVHVHEQPRAAGGPGSSVEPGPQQRRKAAAAAVAVSVTVQQVERYLFALCAIEANVAQYDAIVAQLALKIESVNEFNRALSAQTRTRDFIQSSIVDAFVL